MPLCDLVAPLVLILRIYEFIELHIKEFNLCNLIVEIIDILNWSYFI